MRMIRVGLVVVAGFVLGFAFRVEAVQRYGPLQVSGSLESQNIFRTPDVDDWTFTQQRNTLRLRFDLDVVKDRKGELGFELPGVKHFSWLLLYRPVYDSIYDIKPGGRLDMYPRGKDGSLDDFTTRIRDRERAAGADLDAFHELYFDLFLDALPLSFRIGRQQVVWGESDNFRMLDRVNPLDLTWHLSFELFERIRKPLWIAKFLYRIGNVGPMTEAFVEGYWDLGDWTPAERRFLPYPHSSPVAHPFLNPATCTDPTNRFTCGKFRTAEGVFQRQGDYDRDPIDNGQWGVRFMFVTPQAIQIGLHYFYQRFAFDDASQAGVLQAQNQPGPTGDPATNNLIALGNGILPAAIVYPYIHTVGLSGNYFDEYTATVYRLETIYEIDLPFPDKTKPQLITNPACLSQPPGPTCAIAPRVPSGLLFPTKSDMWKGMLGFDRPTWVRWISRRSTILFTGQFFWHFMVEDPDDLQGVLGAQDKVRQWEIVWSLLATSTLGPGGKYRPLMGLAVDPVNEWTIRWTASVDYFVTNDLFVTPFFNFFQAPGESGRIDQPWPSGGIFRTWDEVGTRITYQW